MIYSYICTYKGNFMSTTGCPVPVRARVGGAEPKETKHENRKHAFGCISGTFGRYVTSLASAQQPPGWAAAAAQCRAQVESQYPTAEESEGMRNARAHGYQACLAERGYRP
jgi:hypothetical protein